MRFAFAFTPAYQAAALPFGITPWTAWVEVSEDLHVRFGPWSLTTPVSNIAGTDITGDYAFVKIAGPAHLSFADRGVTFATNGEKGLCLTFRTPVVALWPLEHPNATLTVANVEALQRVLTP